MSNRIVDLVTASQVAVSGGDGDWRIDDGHAVTILLELGRSVVSLEKVTRIQVRGDLVVVYSSKETHYLPAERVVGLKVEGPAPGQSTTRAGFR